jgi:hypothetical protein
MKTTLEYDDAKKEARIRFANERVLTLGNVTRQQAARFFEKHAPEFEKRDCILTTSDAIYSRRA